MHNVHINRIISGIIVLIIIVNIIIGVIASIVMGIILGLVRGIIRGISDHLRKDTLLVRPCPPLSTICHGHRPQAGTPACAAWCAIHAILSQMPPARPLPPCAGCPPPCCTPPPPCGRLLPRPVAVARCWRNLLLQHSVSI